MDDFERRRELRRQKREEMRLEAERIAYQRNDDDEEEAARERRRRARQERLRQKQEEESLGQVTDQVEAHVQNSVPDEESKPATANAQVEGDEEAALLERLARREERRQKRLQEALERQKEFDPTITDGSLSVPSRRMQNNSAENETAEGEEKGESRSGRYEMEETEVVITSYQKNSYQDAEDKKKEEKEEEEEEEKLKGGNLGENQVEEMVEEKTPETQEEAVVMVLENGQVSAEESKAEGDGEQDAEGIAHRKKMEAEERERAEAERLRLEAEEQERERTKAEQDRKLAEERERREAEERERREAEERERREAEERERREAEEKKAKAEEEAKARRIEEQRQKRQLEEQRSERQEAKDKGEKGAEKADRKGLTGREAQDDRLQTAVPKTQEKEEGKGVKGQAQRQTSQDDKPAFRREEIKDEKIKKDKEPKEEVKNFLDRKKGFTEVKAQNGEFMTHKLKQTENAFSPSRSGGRASGDKEAEGAPQVEAGKRLEELRRRRGETESEEFEKLKQKQQEAALELEELKKKREERRKVLEEEEQRRKQEEADRKAREEEEKRRLKEEIERRRAEAAEKRQKMPEDGLSEDKKPFKCFTPKGSSLKIEERAEFLNKSVQKSGVKSTHQAAVVSKIDSRLEQYTNAIEGTKASKPMKPAASDLPVPAEGVRNIKSMWEKGSVFSSPSASGTPNKETAGLKVGVSSRINEWLTKSPDGNKSPAPKPSVSSPGISESLISQLPQQNERALAHLPRKDGFSVRCRGTRGGLADSVPESLCHDYPQAKTEPGLCLSERGA
ncbi:non-muscle caldesmon isoform X4 [Rattus norvegicus]|uniref:non-muscle caldesmon isoform X4 n=1 Tax=Rattus norvegicus TaxID=10116 RepID=UPI002FD87421